MEDGGILETPVATCSGIWRFTVDMDQAEDISYRQTYHKTISEGEQQISIDSMVLSPMGCSVYMTLPEERRAQGRKAAYDTFRPRHKMATLEEEYQQNLDYYGEIARLFPELGATAQDVETAALEKVYQARHTYQLFEDSIPTLEALRGKYKLGVISDTWPSIVPVLEEFGLPGYFDTLTYSFEVGCFKPDPRMFADALGKMGLPPEQCVFIDDTAQNLVGAQKLGIQPVQIRKKPGADPCPEGMLSIDKISGILELLP